MEELTITSRSVGEILVVSLAGDLDAFSVQKLRQYLNEQLEEENYHLVINCSGVNYINSTAIGVLVGRMRDFRLRGGNLALAELNARVDRILTLVGGRRLFSIFNTEHEAVVHLSEERRSQQQATEQEDGDDVLDSKSWVLNSR